MVDDEVQQLPEVEDDEVQHLRELLAACHRILPKVQGQDDDLAQALRDTYRTVEARLSELGFYGLRKGEILGLTWADFDGKSLDVNKQ